MKKELRVITKFISVLTLLLSLSSCGELTNRLWDSKITGARIEGYFLDKEKKRVVLVGAKNPETNLGMHYSLTDKDGKIFRVFEIGVKSENGIYVGLDRSSARGSRVRSSEGWISFNLTNLSDEDKSFLSEFNEASEFEPPANIRDAVYKKPQKRKVPVFGYYYGKTTKITRYPSSEEKFKNICSETNQDPNCSPIFKDRVPWQGPIRNNFTLTDISWRLLLTPPALVVDAVNYPNYLYQRLR